jgi:hypothetical protein
MDFVAKRYGVLPSVLLREGSSIDIQVAELAVGYQNFYYEQEERKQTGAPPKPPKLSQEEMMAMMERVKKNETKS